MSMSIDQYAQNLYNTYSTQNNSASRLENELNKNHSEATNDELMDVCKEFEAYFAEQVFKSLQSMVPESEESNSSTLRYFKDMMTQEYAKSATQGEGLGLARMMYEAMKRDYGIGQESEE